MSNLHLSAAFSGCIKSVGPRYCLSIEDKVLRFMSQLSHVVYLEPEGLFSNVIYPAGISTSLSINLQNIFVRSIAGLENVKILKYGYAIEYDFFNPLQMYPYLESKLVKNLFFAGQVNGTTGYEEAACQGVIAGINAALKVKGLGQ